MPFRSFVFSPGVISSFRYFAWRFFVISSFRLALFRLGAAPYRQAKRRKNEMAQTSHHSEDLWYFGCSLDMLLTLFILMD